MTLRKDNNDMQIRTLTEEEQHTLRKAVEAALAWYKDTTPEEVAQLSQALKLVRENQICVITE